MWIPWSIRSESIVNKAIALLSNKTVSYQFHGHKLKLALSMGLFSSNDVDSGTLLLLKTLAKERDLKNLKTVVDIGCGAGTIGLAIKAYNPGASVLMRDRDALAVEFTSYNASLNKLDISGEQELFLEGLEEKKYDLIVTNIPAKAGEEVMEDFFLRSPNFLSDKGVVALVIVSSLREDAERFIESCGLDCVYQEHTKMHSVFHFKRDSRRGESKGLSPYIRFRGDFLLEGREYKLDTVYNIPDFDMVGWRQQLAASLLKHQVKSGIWCFWNPGQGHIPVFFHKKCSPGAEKIILTGRDLLQCRITEHNLKNQGFPGDILNGGAPDISALEHFINEKSLDFLSIDLEKPIPRTNWYDPLKKTALKLLKSGGLLLVYGKSNDLHILFKTGSRGFTILSDSKYRGNRCLILKKNKQTS
jgi:predicted RNA methylase